VRPLARRVFAAFLPLALLWAAPAGALAPVDYPAAMRLAVEQWSVSQRPSGFLRYGYDFLADIESEKDSMSAENLTRQAGTASALADYVEWTGDARARDTLVALLSALRSTALPIGKSPIQSAIEKTGLLGLPAGRYKLHKLLGQFGLVYRAEGPGRVLSPRRDYGLAYTGATALALLAEVRFVRGGGDDRFAGDRQAWLEALIGLRIPGLGFRQVADSIDHDAYFDGEAWLALAEYHRTFPGDEHAATALAETDGDLLAFYGRGFKRPFFHWGTMAAAARYQDTRDPKFLEFARMLMREFLEAGGKSQNDSNNCALVEGMADGLAAIQLAGEGKSPLANDARAWIAREMDKASRLLVREGQQGLDFPNARVIAPRMKEFAGSFLAGTYSPGTRVDYAQHCVSAMVKIQRNRLLEDSGVPRAPSR